MPPSLPRRDPDEAQQGIFPNLQSWASTHNAQLNCVANWRAFWKKKRDSLRSQIAAFCYVLNYTPKFIFISTSDLENPIFS